jgi:hypothetical protein
VPRPPALAASKTQELLLSGRLRWYSCPPPEGFKYAALVAVPALASSRRLLLVANLQRQLTELNLRLAAAYLAQFRPS